jgi:hypothetical protein
MNLFYENINDIHIVTEGYQCGYLVKINDDVVYRIDRLDLEPILERLHSIVTSRGNISHSESLNG